MNDQEIVEKIKQYVSEPRFHHITSMTEMAVSLADCYKEDRELVWLTSMLHDIAKDYSVEDMMSVAQKYGYTLSNLSFRYHANMHGEVGALIAEHEFGLKDPTALNAIKYHVSGRPDMTTLEKIIFFSDRAEPGRPNFALNQYLYRIARTNLDEAILRCLRSILDYMETHQIPGDVCELCCNAFDYMLAERIKKGHSVAEKNEYAEMLTDEEFDEALKVVRQNGIKLKSVENVRDIGGFSSIYGHNVKKGMLFRGGNLSGLSEKDAQTPERKVFF